MPVFEYRALDKNGKRVKGIIDADSAFTARNKLRNSDIYPVDLKETSSRLKVQASGQISLASMLRSIKQSELSTMTRQLATLMGAGISLVTSLELLITQESNPLLKKILAQIKESVNEGNSLAYSLSQHPKYFSPIYINMVKAGEASGSLDVVLERLAEFSEMPIKPKTHTARINHEAACVGSTEKPGKSTAYVTPFSIQDRTFKMQ